MFTAPLASCFLSRGAQVAPRRKQWHLILLALLLLTQSAMADVCHVRADAFQPSGNGSDWGSAMALQTALGNAACTEIKMAAGVYRPIVPVEVDDVTEAERSTAFLLNRSMALLGGYSEEGGGDAERDPFVHRTILSGDIDGNDNNDDGNFISEQHDHTVGNNSRRIVTVDAPGLVVSMEGVVITGGRNEAHNASGVGIHNNALLSLRNVLIAGNVASAYGTIYNVGALDIERSTMTGNWAARTSAIYSGVNNRSTLTASAVVDNSGSDYGSVFYGGVVELIDTTVAGNHNRYGNYGGISAYTQLSAVNSTLVANYSYPPAIYAGSMRLVNSIVSGPNVCIQHGDTNVIQIRNSFFSDASCIDPDNPDGNQHGDMAAALDERVQPPTGAPYYPPKAGGPLIDAATADCAGSTDDQRGITRPQGNACDIGAVERVQLNYTLSVAVTGAGRVNGNPVGIVDCTESAGACSASHADAVTLQATADLGHRFAAWGGQCSGNALTQIIIAAATTCTASFAANVYNITFDTQGGDPLNPISGNYGSLVTLPSATRIGYTLQTWNTHADGSGVDHAAATDFILPAGDLTLYAQWVLNRYSVAASVSGGNGSITADPSSTPLPLMVDHGDTANFIVTAATGYHLVQPLGGDCPAGTLTSNSYATAAITGDCEVMASFAQNAAAAVVVQGGDGQSAPVLVAFTDELTVRVADAADVPLVGVAVNFSAPAAGAGAVLSSPTAITDANGLARITVTANGETGSYAVTASVGGVTANFALTNTSLTSTLVLTASPTALPPGGTITLNATVTGEGALIPGGTVDFHVNGVVACAAVPLDAIGSAICTAGPFATGQHEVSASYSGDAAHAPATSGAGAVGFGVHPPAMVPVDSPWALTLLIALFALFGVMLATRTEP